MYSIYPLPTESSQLKRPYPRIVARSDDYFAKSSFLDIKAYITVPANTGLVKYQLKEYRRALDLSAYFSFACSSKINISFIFLFNPY